MDHVNELKCPEVNIFERRLAVFEQRRSTSSHDHVDIFSALYQRILASSSLYDFSQVLFAFMCQVLGQEACLLYFSSKTDPAELSLQRGSYLSDTKSGKFDHAFPTTIELKFNCRYTTNIENIDVLYFSLQERPLPFAILDCFSRNTFSEKLNCGMALRGETGFFALFLYSKPIHHACLDSVQSLDHFAAYLRFSLLHIETLHRASTDQLTGLYRKSFFLQIGQLCLSESCTIQYQLLILDIDFFKQFNDNYGHLEGDNCLAAIAGSVQGAIRTCDLAGRFGGEEFICLLKCSLSDSLEIALRIHRAVANLKLKGQHYIDMVVPTISIGIASSKDCECIENLAERADQALYKAKKLGRNTTVSL